jgi:hypothetical protein
VLFLLLTTVILYYCVGLPPDSVESDDRCVAYPLSRVEYLCAGPFRFKTPPGDWVYCIGFVASTTLGLSPLI